MPNGDSGSSRRFEKFVYAVDVGQSQQQEMIGRFEVEITAGTDFSSSTKSCCTDGDKIRLVFPPNYFRRATTSSSCRTCAPL